MIVYKVNEFTLDNLVKRLRAGGARQVELEAAQMIQELRDELTVANNGLRWIFENGMRIERPEFVDVALNSAYEPVRLAQNKS